MKQGIVLIAHGSRDPRFARPFERIAAALTKKLPSVCVGLAYLEHGPSLEEAVTALVARGVASIRVVPLFLGAGGHPKSDLPQLVAAAAHRGASLALDSPIEEQPEVIEAIATAICEAR